MVLHVKVKLSTLCGELVLRLTEEYKERFVDEVVRIKDEHQGNAVQGTPLNYTFQYRVWI